MGESEERVRELCSRCRIGDLEMLGERDRGFDDLSIAFAWELFSPCQGPNDRL
jgi:hypothetical protein